jgi:16S rRNA processing protein RimM
MKENEVFYIGRLGKPHGVKGEITFLFEDDIFDHVNTDYVSPQDRRYSSFLFSWRDYRFQNGNAHIIKFEDIDTMDKPAN